MFLQAPREWRAIAVGMVVSGILVAVALGIAGGRLGRAGRLPGLRRIVRPRDAGGVTRALAVMAVAGTLVALVPQHVFSPASPLTSYWLPSDVVEYSTQLTQSQGTCSWSAGRTTTSTTSRSSATPGTSRASPCRTPTRRSTTPATRRPCACSTTASPAGSSTSSCSSRSRDPTRAPTSSTCSA
ncbi:hypothetical protein [Clavibacter tessellarius]|uniref:hypothetical protein n=1 Tax=Clavibacter tessellarius TaxID=31965 RepID=UPI003244608D